jgi:hypothetical protein
MMLMDVSIEWVCVQAQDWQQMTIVTPVRPILTS